MQADMSVVLATHPDNCVPAEICLQQCGVSVVSCHSRAEALNAASRGGVHAIFCAPWLSDGSFGDVLRDVHERCGQIPVIVCAEKLDGGWIDLLEAGAFAVISEPFDSGYVRHLLARIQEGCRTPGSAIVL
jgi:DNA-binding NtrC family response regulator